MGSLFRLSGCDNLLGKLAATASVAVLFVSSACGSDAKSSAELGAGGSPSNPGVADGGGGMAGNQGGAGGTGSAGGMVGGAAGGTPGGAPMLQPVSIDACGADNPAKLTAQQVQTLKAGGAGNGMRTLYPYDGTVFPRGLTAPMVMWEGPASQAVYVHLSASLFDYHGCLTPTGTGQLQLPQDVWDKAGAQTRGANDPFTLELTTLNGNAAAGPLKLKLVVAQATLKGSIYYNSYNSQLAGGVGNNGAILRIRPGKTAEVFLRQNTCTGCHSVSANGKRMVARELGIGGGFGGLGGILGGGGASDGQTYSLDANTAPNPAPLRAAAGSSFTGITPDGKFYLASGASLNLGPPLQGGIGRAPANATLYETDSGAAVAGSGVPTSAMMPSFSSDGTLLAFNDHTLQGGRSLSLMTFDPASGKASAQREIFKHASLYPGWPFVLADDGAVVFSLGASNAFTGNGVGISPGLSAGPNSDLAVVDLRTGKTFLLAQAMGFRTQADFDANKTYLPFGAQELHQAYYPTASPVSGGGYFWIFFDSVRNYGNQGLRRQLWGAAIAVPRTGAELASGGYEADPSYPAFYLAGQELPVANHRAFTALDPCRADGASCETGIDCCNGFCTNGICGVDAPRCSMSNETCTQGSDCCDRGDSCIGGYCAPWLL